TTLTSVDGQNARLATRGLAEEIEQLRSAGDGEIAIGGAALAAEAARLGLIDESPVMPSPALAGGGTPSFVHEQRRVDLEHVETRTFESGTVFLRYRVVR